MYGSLVPGDPRAPAAIAQAVAAGTTRLGAAQVAGRLVARDGFPALVVGGEARVPGELLHVRDPALWDALDAYEGVGEPGGYRRELVVALDATGAARSAWAYAVAADAGPGEAPGQGDAAFDAA